ncbi:MAG: DUF481 domain-containing protein [Candidatus Didemnitutus sp.]|nr:DUF481 domain-containing protein [Candidatus Didemnitutus sp.]
MLSKFNSVRLVIFLWIAGFISPLANASTWVLANGDRLRGVLIEETDKEIVIKHAVLGRLTLARSEARLVPVAEGLAGGVTGSGYGEEGSKGAEQRPVLFKPVKKWKRQIELGYARQDGLRDREDLSARVEVETHFGSHSLRASGRVIHSEADNQLVAEREEADFRWRRDFGRKYFVQSLTTYASDEVRKIDLSLEQQLGGGFRVINAPVQQMNVGIGAVVRHIERGDEVADDVMLGSIFQDYTLQWGNRFKLTQEATVFVADRGNISGRGGVTPVVAAPQDGNYRIKFNSSLQSKMTDQISLNLRYEYDFDRSINDVALRSDSRLTTSVGYTW